MKRYFIQFLLLLSCTSLWSAESQLTVNLNGGSADNYLLKDISSLRIVNDVVNVISVSITEDDIVLKNGETYQVIYNISPENATNKAVSWSSSNNNVASIDGNGLITAYSAGNTVITVETEDGELQDMLNVVVTPITSVEISDDAIRIYPNPIQNSLFIEMGDITKYEIVISDISGNILYSQFDENHIDMHNYPTGNYFLTVIVNNKYHNFKLIKN